MSHIVEIQTEVRDATAVQAACRRLNLAEPVHGTARLFSGESTGLIVNLPDWRYPVVCDNDTGQVQSTHYGGRRDDQAHLDRFLQTYAVERAKAEARRAGHSVTEQSQQDGSIKLTVQVAGGAA